MTADEFQDLFDYDTVPATREEIWDLSARCRDWVISFLTKEKAKRWAPAVVVMCRDSLDCHGNEEINLVTAPFNTPDEKAGLVRELGRCYYRGRRLTAAVAMVTDAWFSNAPTPGLPPRKQPDRKEGIAVFAQSMRPEFTLIDFLTYSRDADDVMIVGGWQDTGEVSGTASPLLWQFWCGYFEESAAAMGIDTGPIPPKPKLGISRVEIDPETGIASGGQITDI